MEVPAQHETGASPKGVLIKARGMREGQSPCERLQTQQGDTLPSERPHPQQRRAKDQPGGSKNVTVTGVSLEGGRVTVPPPLPVGELGSGEAWPGLSHPGSSLRTQTQPEHHCPQRPPPRPSQGGPGQRWGSLGTHPGLPFLFPLAGAGSFLSPHRQIITIDLHSPQRPLHCRATFEMPFPGSALARSHGLAKEDNGAVSNTSRMHSASPSQPAASFQSARVLGTGTGPRPALATRDAPDGHGWDLNPPPNPESSLQTCPRALPPNC